VCAYEHYSKQTTIPLSQPLPLLLSSNSFQYDDMPDPQSVVEHTTIPAFIRRSPQQVPHR